MILHHWECLIDVASTEGRGSSGISNATHVASKGAVQTRMECRNFTK